MAFGRSRGLAMAAVLALVTGLPAAAQTLGDALVSAYKNSNLLDQNRALLRAADEDVAQSVAALRPVIDFVLRSNYANSETVRGVSFGTAAGTRYSPESLSSSANLTASITLYDGGAGRLAVGAAKETVLATRQALIGVEQNVLLSAVQAYMNLRQAEDIVALRQSNVRVLSRELEASRDRFELGEITRTDVAIAESRLAAARAELASAEGAVMIGRETYILAVGEPPRNLRQPPRPPVTARSVEEAKRIARAQHYSIRQTQHELAAAELNVQRANTRFGPSVTGSLSVGHNDRGLVDRSVGINLTQRLYQGGGLSAAYRQTLARRDAVRSRLHHQVAIVEQAVGEAWARRIVARTSIEATDRQIVAARAAYDGVREETKLGARTTIDLLNAEQELLEAQAQRLQAVTSDYVAHYQLLSAMGYLTVEHLKLGIPTYDVTGYYNAVKNAPAASARGKRLDRIMETIGRK